MKLLLESEVAQILRCSTEKVKRLRLSGKLAYQPGRPVLVDEADLLAYLESAKVRGRASNRENGPDIEAQASTDTDAWVLKQLIKPRRKPRAR